MSLNETFITAAGTLTSCFYGPLSPHRFILSKYRGSVAHNSAEEKERDESITAEGEKAEKFDGIQCLEVIPGLGLMFLFSYWRLISALFIPQQFFTPMRFQKNEHPTLAVSCCGGPSQFLFLLPLQQL